jgi:hypothetical protein
MTVVIYLKGAQATTLSPGVDARLGQLADPSQPGRTDPVTTLDVLDQQQAIIAQFVLTEVVGYATDRKPTPPAHGAAAPPEAG